MADIQIPQRNPQYVAPVDPTPLVEGYLNRQQQGSQYTSGLMMEIAKMMQNREAQKQSRDYQNKALLSMEELRKSQEDKNLQGLLDYLPADQATAEARKMYGRAQTPQVQQPPSAQPTSAEEAAQQSLPDQHPNDPYGTIKASIGLGHDDHLGLYPNMSRKGTERFSKDLGIQKSILDLSPTHMVSKQDLESRGGMLNPNEKLYPSENRDWNVTTDPTTGRRILVDKITGEVKEVKGLGGGPMSEFTPNQLKVIDDTAKAYSSDDIVSGTRLNLSQVDQLRSLLNSGNPAAPGPFRSNAARVIAGEKGVLTDRDVMRNTGSEAYAAQFKRFIEKASTGQFSEQDKKDFNGLLDLVKNAASKRLSTVTQDYTKRASLRSGINDLGRIQEMISLPTQFSGYSEAGNSAGGGLTAQEQAELAALETRFGGKP